MAVSSESMTFVRDMMKKRAAIAIDDSKQYLVESRLAQLASDNNCSTIDALISRARAGENALHTKILEALVTHETSFFRDQHPFMSLRTEVLPKLIRARQHTRRLFIWSAACSSGQEAYTLAIILREYFPELANWSLKIVGTDISEPVLARARAGRFSQLEVNRGLPAALLLKYFDRDGIHYDVKPTLRELVEFRSLNLIDIYPQFSADVVFMRNVLIYFEVEDKRKILDNVRRVIAPDGALYLGAAETTLNISAGWEPAAFGPSTYFRVK